MQHGGEADARAQVSGVCGDGEQGLGGGLEHDGIDRRLILIGHITDLSGQGEHHMIVFHRQQLSLTRRQPVFGCRTLTLGAVPVAARVVGDVHMITVLARRHMTAELSGAAVLYGRHDLQLGKAHMTHIGMTPGRSVAAEDVRDLQ